MNNQSPFGNYFGSDLTTQQSEKIFLNSEIPMGFIKNENALMKKKWFDYRKLHYIKATYLFAEFYRQAYKRMTRKTNDIDRAEFVRGFKGDDIFLLSSREYKGFWKARFAADKLHVPYDFFINFAMNWANNRLWKRIPRPTQLYSKPLLEDMLAAWNERCRASIPLPIDGHYYLENYTDQDDQNDYQIWLCNQVEQRANPEMALATYMFINPMITQENAERCLSNDIVVRAHRFYDQIK